MRRYVLDLLGVRWFWSVFFDSVCDKRRGFVRWQVARQTQAKVGFDLGDAPLFGAPGKESGGDQGADVQLVVEKGQQHVADAERQRTADGDQQTQLPFPLVHREQGAKLHQAPAEPDGHCARDARFGVFKGDEILRHRWAPKPRGWSVSKAAASLRHGWQANPRGLRGRLFKGWVIVRTSRKDGCGEGAKCAPSWPITCWCHTDACTLVQASPFRRSVCPFTSPSITSHITPTTGWSICLLKWCVCAQRLIAEPGSCPTH